MNTKKLDTVKILANRMIRIGQGLIGDLAGNRELRFNIKLGSKKSELILIPTLKVPGYRVIYYSKDAKSPSVSLIPFLKLFCLPENYFPVGEFSVKKNRQGHLVLDFSNPKNGGGEK